MFERFTEKARRVIFLARWEASHYGSPQIESEHLLLGVLRENKEIVRFLPKVDPESIRSQIDAATLVKKTISTTVDLPLSRESARVLKYAAEEADRLKHSHIGTEHLLLGLLREHDCFAAKLLSERGADLVNLRTRLEKHSESQEGNLQSHSTTVRPIPPMSAATIEIHGVPRNIESIYEAVKRCREYSWHWHKRDLICRDIVVNRKDGAISFDLSLAAEDPTTFELLKAGWKQKNRCAICRWELFESKDDAAHGTGYTNGREWLCTECYEKFWQGPDFFSSSYSDIT
jgi:ATP-dependent Clp protease ATP-binding subunit ClpA